MLQWIYEKIRDYYFYKWLRHGSEGMELFAKYDKWSHRTYEKFYKNKKQ